MSSFTSSSERGPACAALPAETARQWRRFTRLLLGMAILPGVLLYAFVVLVDPWGVLPWHLPGERAPVSTNARYAFAGLAREPRFDAAIFGTSTGRMLRPAALNEAFAARFVNLSMNAATAYEQARLAEVFLRHHPRPRALVLALDRSVWCVPGPLQRYTPRPFPEAFYDSAPWGAYREMFSFYALQEAIKQAGVLAGLLPPPYGRDGYTRFLPPDEAYDAARAARGLPPLAWDPSRAPPPPLWEGDLPPLHVLAALLARVPAETRIVMAFMPVWLGAQPAPGSEAAAILAHCKREVTQVAAGHAAALLLDFLIASPITREPTHFWDPLHFREAIAARIEAHLRRAAAGDPGPSEDYLRLR